MQRHVSFFLIGALLLAGPSCEMVGLSTSSDANGNDRALVGPTWQLVAFEHEDGTRTSPGPVRPEHEDVAYTIAFTEQPADGWYASREEPAGPHRMKAVGYPNEGIFTYEPGASGALSIYFHAATEIASPPGSKEAAFFEALDAATSYRIEGDRLRIAYGGGKALLFEARA